MTGVALAALLTFPMMAQAQGMVFDAAPVEEPTAETADAADGPGTEEIEMTFDPAQVLADVDGIKVTRADLEELLGQLNAQARALPLEAIYQPLINQLVLNKLVLAEAEKVGTAEKEEVKERIARRAEQIVFEAYIEDRVNAAITEDVMRAEYAKFVAAQTPEDEVRARHILVETEETARELLAELVKGGDFAELAKEHSTGPSGPEGGDLGFFTKDVMVPAFAEKAFNLKPGQISREPVKTQFGWHLIKVEERRKKPAPEFAMVEDQIKQRLGREFIVGYLDSLREDADVTLYNLDGTVMKVEEKGGEE
ncbi:MAG: peptidylprolyl isomerase [Alphaproteobacteria bacterium]